MVCLQKTRDHCQSTENTVRIKPPSSFLLSFHTLYSVTGVSMWFQGVANLLTQFLGPSKVVHDFVHQQFAPYLENNVMAYFSSAFTSKRDLLSSLASRFMRLSNYLGRRGIQHIPQWPNILCTPTRFYGFLRLALGASEDSGQVLLLPLLSFFFFWGWFLARFCLQDFLDAPRRAADVAPCDVKLLP